ncbi:phage tail tape measure protein, partial [Methanosarcinales archaeon]
MPGNIVEIIIKARDLASSAFRQVQNQIATTKTIGVSVASKLKNVGRALYSTVNTYFIPAALAIAGVAFAIKGLIDAFGDFDMAMKGVQKTTGMSEEEIDALGEDFKEMSTQIPLSAKELADIGAIAGQLGIQGSDNITTFTESVARVSIALDMTAEEAATSMAKVSNAFGLPVTQADNLASSINTLENTTAAKGRDIIASMTRMAASGAQLGLTADAAAALAATLIAMGMPAERVGTRLNTAFTQMAKNVGDMAAQMGMSEEELRAWIDRDVMGALNAYIEMLRETPSEIDRITMANEVFGAVGGKAIASLATGYDDLQT